jgi:hypothetical protein
MVPSAWHTVRGRQSRGGPQHGNAAPRPKRQVVRARAPAPLRPPAPTRAPPQSPSFPSSFPRALRTPLPPSLRTSRPPPFPPALRTALPPRPTPACAPDPSEDQRHNRKNRDLGSPTRQITTNRGSHPPTLPEMADPGSGPNPNPRTKPPGTPKSQRPNAPPIRAPEAATLEARDPTQPASAGSVDKRTDRPAGMAWSERTARRRTTARPPYAYTRRGCVVVPVERRGGPRPGRAAPGEEARPRPTAGLVIGCRKRRCCRGIRGKDETWLM